MVYEKILLFKRGLLNSLGIDPLELDVFFAENAQFIPVGDGYAIVDSSENVIYASIEHFSTIVVRKSTETTATKNLKPAPVEMLDIFPNPFNKQTTIFLTIVIK